MIYDENNREYVLIGANANYTVLECVETGDIVKVTSSLFNSVFK